MRKQKIHTGKFERYIRRTLKNKICSLALLGIGVLSVIPEREITVLVLISIFAIPLFFAKEDWIN